MSSKIYFFFPVHLSLGFNRRRFFSSRHLDWKKKRMFFARLFSSYVRIYEDSCTCDRARVTWNEKEIAKSRKEKCLLFLPPPFFRLVPLQADAISPSNESGQNRSFFLPSLFVFLSETLSNPKELGGRKQKATK